MLLRLGVSMNYEIIGFNYRIFQLEEVLCVLVYQALSYNTSVHVDRSVSQLLGTLLLRKSHELEWIGSKNQGNGVVQAPIPAKNSSYHNLCFNISTERDLTSHRSSPFHYWKPAL